MKAVNLRTAHLVNPIGIDLREPLLTWTAEGGIRQTAYEVRLVCDGTEIHSTSKIAGSQMSCRCAVEPQSRKRIFWKVRLWDENDQPSEWSDTVYFEYGFINRNDWKAKWINPEIAQFNPKEHQPASYLKKEFVLEACGNARIYASAHGMYALWINGERVNENILTPGTSEYWKRLPYQTFDVSSYLKKGNNRIDVLLGDGWWRGSNGNTGTRNVFGTDIAFLMQLEVNQKTVLITDETWQASQDGPVMFNDLQLGERVNACNVPSYHDVNTADFGYDNLVCANTVPIVEKESFSAKLIVTPSGKKVLDFGQNMAGYVSFRLNGEKGQKITMTHGEYIGSDGEFSDSNLQTVGRKSGELHQVIEYTCKEGINEYKPALCIFGFQYVLVETDIDIDGSEFTAHAVYSDIMQTAWFECDQPLVNQLFKNAVWSMKSNFVDIPTDCPQRERSGWTGDAALFCHTGLTLMDCYPVYERWLAECRASQYEDGRVANFSPRRSTKPSLMDSIYDGSSAWGDASVIVPYTMYQLYGDEQILRENYEFGRRWLAYCEKKAKKSRLKNRFSKNPYKNYTIDTGMHYGEWLEAGVSMEDAMKDIIFNGAPDVATAYFAQSCRMMSEIAKILGKKEDEEKYGKLAHNAVKAYRYHELKDGLIVSGRQCRYVRPLQMGLLNHVQSRQAAADLNALVEDSGYKLNTGFLTTAHLCSVLAEYGYVETAYRLLLQEETPGWLYQVKQGATTVWESWEGNTGSTGVASLNHYSKGAVVSWLIEGIAGIRVSASQIMIKPQVNPLMKHAYAKYESPYGMIESGWKYTEKGIDYKVSIPANTKAVFITPDGRERELSAGTYQFTL